MNQTNFEKLLNKLYDMYGFDKKEEITRYSKTAFELFKEAGLTDFDLENVLSVVKDEPPNYMPKAISLLKIAKDYRRDHKTEADKSDGLKWYREHMKQQFKDDILLAKRLIKGVYGVRAREDVIEHLLEDDWRDICDYWMVMTVDYRGRKFPLLTEEQIKDYMERGYITKYVPEDARRKWAVEVLTNSWEKKPFPYLDNYYDKSKTNPQE